MYSLVLTEVPNYYIDNLGNVFRLQPNGKLRKKKPIKSTEGYIEFELNLGKARQRLRTSQHRLLAKAFIPNPENKPTVDHINRNKKDNRLENLRWATYSENVNNRKTLPKGPYRYCSKRLFPHVLKKVGDPLLHKV